MSVLVDSDAWRMRRRDPLLGVTAISERTWTDPDDEVGEVSAVVLEKIRTLLLVVREQAG